MDFSAVVNALHFAVILALPLLVGVVVAAILAGVLQAATQIQDGAISLVSRLGGIALALYLYGTKISTDLLNYASRLWGGADFYHW